VSIQPSQATGVWRDLVPGVRVLPYAGPLRTVMERMDTKVPPQAHSVVARSHILLIRPTRYLAAVQRRIQAEGGSVPKGAVEIAIPHPWRASAWWPQFSQRETAARLHHPTL